MVEILPSSHLQTGTFSTLSSRPMATASESDTTCPCWYLIVLVHYHVSVEWTLKLLQSGRFSATSQTTNKHYTKHLQHYTKHVRHYTKHLQHYRKHVQHYKKHVQHYRKHVQHYTKHVEHYKTVPTVYQSSKTVKQQKWPQVYQSSHVYTESAEYTKPTDTKHREAYLQQQSYLFIPPCI